MDNERVVSLFQTGQWVGFNYNLSKKDLLGILLIGQDAGDGPFRIVNVIPLPMKDWNRSPYHPQLLELEDRNGRPVYFHAYHEGNEGEVVKQFSGHLFQRVADEWARATSRPPKHMM